MSQTDEPRSPPPAGSVWQDLVATLQRVGRDVLAVARGRPAEPADSAAPPANGPTPSEPNKERLGVMHAVAERLRSAADSYVAAKLDEIEARVDEKLDHIEHRLDRKLVELHKQLAEMRDRELRHRLRLLKITLIFSVLVAVLSLVYKWVAAHWVS